MAARERFEFYFVQGDRGAFIESNMLGGQSKAALVIDRKTEIVYQVVVGFNSGIMLLSSKNNALDIVRETVEAQEA